MTTRSLIAYAVDAHVWSSTIAFARRTPFRSYHGLRIRTIDIALLRDVYTAGQGRPMSTPESFEKASSPRNGILYRIRVAFR